MGIWNFFNQTAMVGKAAATYVLFFLFTGSGIIVGYEKLHNLPVDPVSSGLLFGAFSWAIGTLNFHMAAGNLQSQADIISQVQRVVPDMTKATVAASKSVNDPTPPVDPTPAP